MFQGLANDFEHPIFATEKEKGGEWGKKNVYGNYD